jgi:hypothetical protein
MPHLWMVLVFMARVSTDPNVSLQQGFTAFHFANDDAGKRLCDQWRRDFNRVIVERHATDAANDRQKSSSTWFISAILR